MNQAKLCQCKSCGFVYPISESKMKSKKMYNIDVREIGCPNCDSSSFKVLDLPTWMDRYLLVNQDKRYYE